MNIPKAAWGTGLWQDEPDRAEWRDAATGLPCLAVRNHLGAWCGYVGVYPGHPPHGKDYDAVDVDVHGGLTYSGACSGDICHTPEPGEPEVHWFGFDCAHAGDLCPEMRARHRFRWPPGHPLSVTKDEEEYEQYRSLAYVRAEMVALAAQLAGRTKTEEGS